MNILFLSSEVASLAHTGGLGDVAAALPKNLGLLGHNVCVIMPRYKGLPKGPLEFAANVRVYFVDNPLFFQRSGLYGTGGRDYPDNLLRFTRFCHDALGIAKKISLKPDILHLNDWQTALAAVYLRTHLSTDAFYQGCKSILTIHNLAYQGLFAAWQYPFMGVARRYHAYPFFEFYGKINLMKAGISYAHWLSTVSPTYAQEIMGPLHGCGLQDILYQKRSRMTGILNGIDQTVWDPAHDPAVDVAYDANNPSGKAQCKKIMESLCGFDDKTDAPLIALVSRLTHQKGIDWIVEAAPQIFSKKLRLVILGEGESRYKQALSQLALQYPGKLKCFFGFGAIAASRLYASADFFLMPSVFEPCGLGQLIALRYGALPIVRKTGGLADTIRDVDEYAATGNGFSFEEASPEALSKTIDRALIFYQNRQNLERKSMQVMNEDHSWATSAKQYSELYEAMRRES